MSLDVVALLDRLTKLVELASRGEGGVAGLQAATELTTAATGAVGATFVEYGRAGGRVVAATEELGWALGRPQNTADPFVMRLLTGPSIQDFTVDQLTEETRRQLASRGIGRVLRASASADGMVVGALNACFAHGAPPADDFQHAAVRLLAACAAHLYRESAGLPVYPDGPALPSLAQGMA